MDLDKNETPIDNCSYPICVKKSPMSRLIERGIPAPVMIARILAVALLGLSLKGQQPSREYIRLGGRVIAIENPPDVLTPSSAVFQAAGGTGQIQVVKTGSWAGHSNAGWIHFTAPAPDQSGNIAGSGTLTVNYSVDPNITGAQLNGTLTIAGASFSVTENGGSQVLSVDQPQMTVPGTGGSATFHVTSTGGASWLVQSFPSWIHIADTTVLPPSSPLTASRDVTFLFDPNPLGSTTSRSGTICLVSGCSGGPAVQVTQTGGLTFSPTSPASVSSNAQNPTVGVTAPTGTSWTAFVNQGDQGWLSIISGGSGSGNGTVTYHVTSNVGGNRDGTLLIGGNSYTVSQAGGAAGTLSISPSSWIFTVAGSQQFTALLNGSQTTATWGFSGYNYGTINTSSGLYTAPGSCSNSGGMCTDTITASKAGASTAYANVWTSYGSSGNGSALLWSPTQNYGTNWDIFTLWIKDWFILPLQIMPVEVLVTPNTSPQPWPSTSNSCFMTWDMANSQQAFPTLHPAVSGETDQSGTFQYGGTKFPAVIANSLCELDLSRTTWRRLGNDMLIDMRLLFRPAFAGNKGIYLRIPATGYNPYPNGIPAAQYAVWTSPGYSPPNVDITSPSANASVAGTAQLTGWALDNASGPQTPLSKVEVFVDGAKVGDAQRNQAVPNGVTNYCSQYPDQTGISPGWDCPNFGWTYPWNTTAASNGDHLIRIVATDTDPTPGVTFVERHFTVNNLPSVAAPAFNPAGGTYPVTQSVVLQSATAGATIVFTTDGSTPTASHGTVYASPVTVANSMTVKAFAYKSGMTDSSVAQATYTIGGGGTVATPSFSPAAGTYSAAQTVTISTTTSSATIRYTTDGSTPTSSVGTVYSGPVSVSSSMTLKAIAYKSGMSDSAVASASYIIGNTAVFVRTDTATQGTWKGMYGVNGYNVFDDTTSYPAYVTVTPANQSDYIWAGSTSDVRALQKGVASTDRIASTWYTYGTFTIDLNFNDGAQHQVAVYALDWDSLGRAGTISVLDGGTNAVLDTQNLSNFQNGKYLVWNLTGHVVLRVTNTGTTNMTTGGLFFDPPGGANISAAFVNTDTATQGTWKGKYGVNGYNVFDDTVSYPSYVTVTPANQLDYVWAGSTSDVRALQKALSATDRIASTWYTYGSFTLDLNFKDGAQHQVAVYALDWDSLGRAGTVSVLNGITNAVLDTQNLTSFQNGKYLVWNLTGHVVLGVTNTGSTNTTIGGLFFDPPGSPTVAAPTFNPPAGTYSSTQSVTISTTTSGANIRYTTDGSTPSSTVGTVYSGPVSVSSNLTLRAIAYKVGMTDSSVASGDYLIQVATPTFNPAAGTYTSAQSVAISTTTSGASIRYTTDGSTPSSTVGTVYSGPVSVSSNLTLKAIAYKSGLADSSVASSAYTISPVVATPTFNPAAGTFSSAQSVTISTTTSGATIRYTTDGSTPTSSSGTVYSGAVPVSSSLTLKAVAYKAGMTDSAVASADYTISSAGGTVAAPTFSPGAGTYSTTQSVTISSTTSGASIRYTTDGTTPTSSSGTIYSGPVTVSSSLMLKAIAYKTGMADSSVAATPYIIGSSSSDLLLENLTFGSGTASYQASNSITADNFIANGSAAVAFAAGNHISLENGFHATAGTTGVTFHAFIGP